MSAHCNHCGFDNPPGMKFCGNCGARLDDSSPPAEPVAPGQLGALMGADLLQRFRKAGLEAAGQRRNVTVLFVDLTGFTHLAEQTDSEALYELVQQFIRLLANDVYKYEGMVDKFTGDGLMALFGAPIAHESNAELALRAALDMQADVASLSAQLQDSLHAELKIHVGLHSGTVVVGGIGSDMLMNYTAIGDSVNLAQRLESAAGPGEILVSEAVYRQTAALFDFEPVAALQLKGVTRPVNAFRALRPKARPGSARGVEGLRAPMVGRESELESLLAECRRLQTDGSGHFALVTGEAGIGKSRLVRELKSALAASGVQVMEGQSLTYRRAVAYWIFLDALRRRMGLTAEALAEQLRPRLSAYCEELLGPRSAEALPFLEHMFSLPPASPAAERIRYLEAGQLQRQIFLAVRDLLVAEARRTPLLFVLDDLHWADSASLDLLAVLLEALPGLPLVIVGISRPFSDDQPLAAIHRQASQQLAGAYTALGLRSLSPDQTSRLLAYLLDIPTLPESLRQQILERSAGIPFYLEEILRMLIDSGAIRRVEGEWRFDGQGELAGLGVPETLEGLILARFDRLSEVQRRVLQVASAVGREFGVAVLQGVLRSMDREMLRDALQKLTAREFLLAQPGQANAEFAFRHVLTADAIYKTLLKRDRSELHGQIGEAIESVYARQLEGQIEILARHYSWSPRLDRALHYLILAGQKAARNFSNPQARQYFEQALGLLPQVGHLLYQSIQVHNGLGDALLLAGEYPVAREQFEATLHSLEKEDPALYAEERCAVLRRLAAACERQGDYDQALIHLEQAHRALQYAPIPMPAEQAQVIHDIGWIHFRRGNIEEAEKSFIQSLSLAEGSSRFDVIASVYNRLGGVYFQKDQLDRASTYVRKSLVLREEMGDRVAVARSYSNLGLLAWRQGDWDRALENFQRGLELNASLGDVEGMINLQANIGLLLTDKGDLTSAQRNLENCLQSAQRIGHGFLEAMACHHLSRMWLAGGDWQQSLAFSQRALDLFAQLEAVEHLPDVHASKGEAWLGLGRLDQAAEALAAGMALLDPAQDGGASLPERGRLLRLQGRVAQAQGDWELADRLLRQSLHHFSEMRNQLELGRTLAALAHLAQARGDQTAFRLHSGEARIIFAQLGARLDLDNLS